MPLSTLVAKTRTVWKVILRSWKKLCHRNSYTEQFFHLQHLWGNSSWNKWKKGCQVVLDWRNVLCDLPATHRSSGNDSPLGAKKIPRTGQAQGAHLDMFCSLYATSSFIRIECIKNKISWKIVPSLWCTNKHLSWLNMTVAINFHRTSFTEW